LNVRSAGISTVRNIVHYLSKKTTPICFATGILNGTRPPNDISVVLISKIQAGHVSLSLELPMLF